MALSYKFLANLVFTLHAAIALSNAETDASGYQPATSQAKFSLQPAPYGLADSLAPHVAALTSSKDTGSDQNQQLTSGLANQSTNKLRVNVSNICEKNHMRVTIRLNRPFYGLIHAKDFRRRPTCSADGTGEQSYTLDIAFTQVQSDSNYCGVVSHHLARLPTQPISTQPLGQSAANNQTSQSIAANLAQQQQQTLSVALVVRLHKTIEFSDDRYFLLSCANRCSRSDCSSMTPTPVGQQHTAAQHLRNFIASESIVSPVLRPASSSDPAKLTDPISSWVSQRCDAMLDMKFSWMVRLCWLLTALLIVTICVIIYLSYQLYQRAASLDRQLSKRRTLARASGNQSLRSTVRSHRTAPNRDNNNSLLTKVYENNSFLAEQNKQLILANQFLSNNQTSGFSQQAQAELQQPIAIPGPVVVGRSSGYESSFSTGHMARRHQVEAQLKGRRSIGSSMAMLVPPGLADPTKRDRYLGASQRLKSRSQNTIHYDQDQDPFKAISFNYQDTNNNNGNSGYLYSYSH